MKQFMDKDFLLTTETSKKLYHEYASVMPVLDYHCHINPQEIYEDRAFENITQVWLGADHYKWRQMRSNGVEEKYITGDASDREKFQKWAETLEMAIGNPLYHWSHLELQRFFGYEGWLNGDTAEEVWNLCNEKLQNGMTARKMIEMSNVTLVCTTDDPADSLEWHQKIAADDSFKVQVLPAWRPEKAMNITKPDYTDYLDKLSRMSKVEIVDFKSLIEALKNRMEFFHENGCTISDHSLDYVMYAPASEEQVEEIFRKRLAGGEITPAEKKQFETAFMIALGREYHKKNWVMQLHFAVKRDNNESIFASCGPDAGIDCISNFTPADQMADFLNALAKTNQLPKTILYSLNPADNATIGTIMGCFQGSEAI